MIRLFPPLDDTQNVDLCSLNRSDHNLFSRRGIFDEQEPKPETNELVNPAKVGEPEPKPQTDQPVDMVKV